MSLTLEAVTIATSDTALMSSFNLEVGAGEIVTLMGPSGRGKTMLLNYLTGHLPNGIRATGEVRLDGRRIDNLRPEDRALGILFQDDLLFPHMSLGENLMFAVPRSVKGRDQRRLRALEALAWAQLDEFFDRHVLTLSGGQGRRAALVRALLAEPKAMLLDEPFTALDLALREEIRAFTVQHLKERHIPTLLVTHDPSDAEAAQGRVFKPWG